MCAIKSLLRTLLVLNSLYASKDKFLSENFIPVLKHMLDPVKLLKFAEDNSKKTTIKFDKREVVGFTQLVINQQYRTDKIGIEFKKLVKD